MDPVGPRVDSRRPVVWYRDIPCRHPAALGGRTSRPLDCVGPNRCPSPQRISAEDRYTSGSCSCLARVCALVGAANATPYALQPRAREERVSTNWTSEGVAGGDYRLRRHGSPGAITYWASTWRHGMTAMMIPSGTLK